MRNTLIILDYQREIPPFLQNLIHYADSRFDRIIYFTPELHNDNRESCSSNKLIVVQCERSIWRRSLFFSPFFFLSKDVRDQLSLARKNNLKLFPIVKQIHRHYVCSRTLANKVISYVKQENLDIDDTIVLGAWFSTEAYALNMLKNKFPQLYCCSFAHSFEINRNQNPFVMYDMNSFKHKNLDNMIFISNQMRNVYFKELSSLYPDVSDSNWNTIYLGSIKKYPDKFSTLSQDGVIRIVSCSSVVKVKRIHLIIETLNKWNGDIPIKWTHIGGGPLLDEMKEKANSLLSNKSNVSFEFLGAFTNDEVQKYYTEHDIDLFLNVSFIEGLPVSIMESISYGIPVIATNVGGTSEIVNTKTGFLLKRDFKANELLDLINEYITMSISEKKELREECLSVWKNDFNAETNSNRIYDVIQNDVTRS